MIGRNTVKNLTTKAIHGMILSSCNILSKYQPGSERQVSDSAGDNPLLCRKLFLLSG
jgi:hypothetical protein